MVTIKDAIAIDIPVIRDLAEKTWWPVYSPIVSSAQIRYMLDTIYAPQAIKEAMDTRSQHFIIISDNDNAHGFASYGIRPEEPETAKVHKLYVLSEQHGKGYGRMLMEEVKKRIKETGIHTLDLNVNRNNPAYHFYLKLGFTVIREEDIQIGPYWMNDYVMRLTF